MSDLPDLDEVDFERSVAPEPDLRSRLDSACRAAGVSPAAVVAGLAVVLVVLLAGAAWLLSSEGSTPPVEASLPFTRPPESITTTSTTPSEIVVHVAGAVGAPGVYRLPADSRVIDALDAASGGTATADLSKLNLAAGLSDGQQVYVVAFGEESPPSAAVPAAGPGAASALIDLNVASAAELEALPGIGPALAAAIVSHRDEHGPFVAVESLLDVSGIGEAKLAGLRDFAAV